MKAKRSQSSGSDLKKWGFFLVFLIMIGVALVLIMQPGSDKEAREMITRAESLTRQAQDIAARTNAPQDRANADLARESLDQANNLRLLGEAAASLEESTKAISYAQKVIENVSDGQVRRSGIRFEDARGDILVRSKGTGIWRTGDDDSILGAGDRVKTNPKSGTRIVFDNGMSITVHNGTELVLQDNVEANAETYRLMIALEKGSISVETAEGGSARVHVLTDAGRAVFYRQTKGRIGILSTSTKPTEVRVREGRTDVRSGSKSLDLYREQMVTFTNDLFKNEATSLPPAPLLDAPKPFSKFPANDNGIAPVAFRWENVTEVRGYQFQLSTEVLFVNPIEDRRLSGSARFELPNLNAGLYFWRVASIGAGDVASFYSEPRQVEVTAQSGQSSRAGDERPPKLRITKTSVQGYIAIISGVTDRDATVKVNNDLAVVDNKDGTFSAVLSFANKGDYPVLIAAESPSGSMAIQELTVTIKE